jgi:rod shape-determining protein MreC
MGRGPEGLHRFGDKLLLAFCVVVSFWMMSGDEATRIARGSPWRTHLNRFVAAWSWVGEQWSELRGVRAENEQLRARLAEVRLDVEHVQRERERIEQLERRAGFYQAHRGSLMPAGVVRMSVDRIPVQARIRCFPDGGDSVSQRLEMWQAVVDERGLAGRISEIFPPHEARVQLLTDEESRVSVEIARSGVTGLLRYDGRRFLMDHVPVGESVQPGDMVISSDLGSTLPRGLKVGVVRTVEPSPLELFQHIEIDPSVRFSALRHVYVVVNPGPWYALPGEYGPDVSRSRRVQEPPVQTLEADSTAGAAVGTRR